MIVIDDITGIRKAYEERERSERLSSLGQFAAGIAHELRNPLTGINILLEMVKEDAGISKESIEIIDKVLNENAHLEDMVTSMLEITKPMDLRLTRTKLNRVLEDFIDHVKKIAAKRQIHIEGKGLEKDIMAMLDVKKINQALINLFNNSMDSMKKGGRFTVELMPEGNSAMIIMEDTGSGIPPEIMDKIYEPFYTTKQTGTGLGLYITMSIIKQHNGIISAESDGKTFTRLKICLPSS
jgi:signal transduction histidine kinase